MTRCPWGQESVPPDGAGVWCAHLLVPPSCICCCASGYVNSHVVLGLSFCHILSPPHHLSQPLWSSFSPHRSMGWCSLRCLLAQVLCPFCGHPHSTFFFSSTWCCFCGHLAFLSPSLGCSFSVSINGSRIFPLSKMFTLFFRACRPPSEIPVTPMANLAALFPYSQSLP